MVASFTSRAPVFSTGRPFESMPVAQLTLVNWRAEMSLAALAVEDVEEAVLVGLHQHSPLRAVDGEGRKHEGVALRQSPSYRQVWSGNTKLAHQYRHGERVWRRHIVVALLRSSSYQGEPLPVPRNTGRFRGRRRLRPKGCRLPLSSTIRPTRWRRPCAWRPIQKVSRDRQGRYRCARQACRYPHHRQKRSPAQHIPPAGVADDHPAFRDSRRAGDRVRRICGRRFHLPHWACRFSRRAR